MCLADFLLWALRVSLYLVYANKEVLSGDLNGAGMVEAGI